MGFLKNCWYLAGWGEELAPGAMLPRRIAGQPLLFLRSANGTASVMDDRCPHRLVPLSRGQFIDDQMVCAYHGLAFGTEQVAPVVPAVFQALPVKAGVSRLRICTLPPAPPVPPLPPLPVPEPVPPVPPIPPETSSALVMALPSRASVMM